METIQENERHNKEAECNHEATTPVKQFFDNSPSTNNRNTIQVEEEDDINTIGSNETSHYKNNDKRQVPPPFIRYQFGISINQIKDTRNQDESDDESSEESSESSDDEHKEKESPASKTIRFVRSILEYLHRFDPEAQFVS